MELAIFIYLIGIFDTFSSGSIIPVTLLVGGAITALWVGYSHDRIKSRRETTLDEDHKDFHKTVTRSVKTYFYVNLVVLLLALFAPDKETSYTMMAAYGVQSITESEEVQAVAGKSLKVLEQYMDKYLEQTEE